MSEPAANPDIVGGETRCDCGWKLPVHIVANVYLKRLRIVYQCPECGTGHLMERDEGGL